MDGASRVSAMDGATTKQAAYYDTIVRGIDQAKGELQNQANVDLTVSVREKAHGIPKQQSPIKTNQIKLQSRFQQFTPAKPQGAEGPTPGPVAGPGTTIAEAGSLVAQRLQDGVGRRLPHGEEKKQLLPPKWILR
jgi:hypothetical protein